MSGEAGYYFTNLVSFYLILDPSFNLKFLKHILKIPSVLNTCIFLYALSTLRKTIFLLEWSVEGCIVVDVGHIY